MCMPSAYFRATHAFALTSDRPTSDANAAVGQTHPIFVSLSGEAVVATLNQTAIELAFKLH